MLNDEMVKYRLECLKLSYDINFKIGNIKSSYEKQDDVHNDLMDVFSLADMNFEYILHGNNPIEEENEANELIS